MADPQTLILRHALGMGDDGSRAAYRNHFVTGPGSKDYASCMALVEREHMIRRDGSPLTGGDYLFMVTDRAVLRPGRCRPAGNDPRAASAGTRRSWTRTLE